MIPKAEEEAPKRVTKTVAPVEAVPWFRQSSMILALTTTAGGLYGVVSGLCEAGLWCLKIPEGAFTKIVVGAVVFVGGVVWGAKRIKQGNDPSNPLPKITAL